jgi:ABC-2 type transport system permease protein
MTNEFSIFTQFLWRDAHIFLRRVKGYIFNYMILYPIMYSLSFGYLLPLTTFGSHDIGHATLVFSGTMLLFLQVIIFVVNLDFLKDLESERYIDYQLTLVSAPWIILERITFTALFCAFIAFPYFPLSKLLLGTTFDTSNTNWPALFMVILVSTFLFATFNMLCTCLVSSRSLPKFWVRVYAPLIIFGGFLVPWSAMKNLAPFFGYFLLINPMLYVSEGLRQAIIGGPNFFSLWISLGVLLTYLVLFFALTIHFFRKRLDCL